MTHTFVVFIIHALILAVIFRFAFFSPLTACKFPWRHKWPVRWANERWSDGTLLQVKNCDRCNKRKSRTA